MALIAAFATSFPHRCGRMSYTTEARNPECVSTSAIVRDVAGAAEAEPIRVVPVIELRTCPGPTVSEDSVVTPSTTGTAPPSAVLIASLLPTPFCSEMIGAAGFNSPANGRSARSVSTALTKRKSICEPKRSRAFVATRTRRAGSSLICRPRFPMEALVCALASSTVTLHVWANDSRRACPSTPRR